MEIKLCKNCNRQDPVNGEKMFNSCYTARSTECGEEAKYFEVKGGPK